MSSALSAGVSGVSAHQRMLDVAGSNLANANTIGFKSSRIIFSQLLSETLKKASLPTSTIGGTNPQQIGSGVGIATITSPVTQGNISNTGRPLDLALEGQGYFVLNDGSKDLYTRAGAFAVDANSTLVDPATGYRVQRIGAMGESDGFQTPGDSNIRIPYDVAIQARATSQIKMAGNLSATGALDAAQTNVLASSVTYTTGSGTTATGTTELDQLDQFSGTLGTTTTITTSGYDPSGNALTDTGLTVTGSTTLQDVIDHLNSNVLTSTEQVASLEGGRITITDIASGYSRSDMNLTWADNGSAALTMPAYFEITTVGGEEVKNASTVIYDSLGGKHVVTVAMVRTNTANTWDMVVTSVGGNISSMTNDNRRINGIKFDGTDASFAGLTSVTEPQEFRIAFAHDPTNPQVIEMDLGTKGKFDGLTQFASLSTAVASEQDGYASGNLSSVSVSNSGVVIGSFSNGIKKDLATIQVATFRNPGALENVGRGYLASSVNSGNAVATQAMIGIAGTIHSGALEDSNVDIASLFAGMIQAQNGYTANARTIRMANEMLRTLTDLMR